MKHTKLILLTVIASICSTVQSNPRTMQSFAYYQQKTREFLTHLGVNNANAVQVKRLQRSNNSVLGHTAFSGTFNHLGIMVRGSMEICLNEQAFRHISEGMRLFTCAHEAAHYARNHPMTATLQGNRVQVIRLEQEADEYAARMLCANGYRWVVQEVCNNAYQFVRNGQGHIQPDHEHPSYSTTYGYLTQILNGNPATPIMAQNNPSSQPRTNKTQKSARNRTQGHPIQKKPAQQTTYTPASGPSGYRNQQHTQATQPNIHTNHASSMTHDWHISDFKEYLSYFVVGIAIYTGYHIYKNITTSTTFK
ncbi:MAG TPA: hypothetical protein PLU71_02905 [Candidatus Dependentiae bacterium]|nr:hypothetical protein [Candidatus Dependentiae bacterium]HRQ62780.1 hypothetical protein [Candidatus Dependentiae bacterium]